MNPPRVRDQRDRGEAEERERKREEPEAVGGLAREAAATPAPRVRVYYACV